MRRIASRLFLPASFNLFCLWEVFGMYRAAFLIGSGGAWKLYLIIRAAVVVAGRHYLHHG